MRVIPGVGPGVALCGKQCGKHVWQAVRQHVWQACVASTGMHDSECAMHCDDSECAMQHDHDSVMTRMRAAAAVKRIGTYYQRQWHIP